MPRPVIADPLGHGSLCDVAGVLVGHHHRIGRGWQTGTTAVIVPGGAVAAVDVRGGGPGTRETDALDPRNLVDRVHGICLSGGSAYGLAAADGVMGHLEGLRLGVAVGPDPGHVVPVVPAAVIFDLGRGGVFGNRPDAQFGQRAARSARRRVARGTVGAGVGARAGGLQGGVGMASMRVEVDDRPVTVAALAVVNPSGTVIDPATGRPWVPAGLRRPSRDDRIVVRAVLDGAAAPVANTTIGVVACDALVARPEVGRLAMAAHDGLARAVRPAHGMMDGDTIFGLATGAVPLTDASAGIVRGVVSRAAQLNLLAAAAADVFATACTDAVATATTVGEAPAYRDICRSAYPVDAFTDH